LAAKNANAAKGEPRRKRRKLESDRPPSEEESDVEIEDDNEDVSMEEQDVGPTEEESEAEESGSEQATGDANQSEKDDIDESEFEAHFERPNENELAMRLKAISENKWTSTKVDTTGGRCLLQVPSSDEKALTRRRVRTTKDIRLKSRLITNAQEVLKDFTKVEQAIAPSLFGYQDVLFGARTPQNANRLRDMTCLHALNHILKTRDRILKNTSKLAAASDDLSAEYRDQGFTRPKILFLLETKQACVRAIDSITKLHDFEQQENKKRFLDNFSQPEDKFSSDKPDDFRELFEGNDENEFRIGVKLTRKTLKFYSTFYNSDIIFASALGLRRAIESPSPTSKTKDFDFLSSIEMVFMEDASATLMQNWEHADYVFEHLNLQPKETHGCDFSRVRSWYLDGHAARMRQTIVLSAYLTPKITALWNGRMRNAFGRLKYTPDYTAGLIETLPHGIKQTFSRFESKSHVSDPDARFKFFTSTVLPSITKLPKPPQGGLGVLVFIPSYLDFVRVRNALVDIDISYASISEYTDLTDVRKARSHFASGRHSLLLYTGRAHHFHRYHIRGVKRVVFYGVPENPRFYDEVVGFVGKSVERSEIGKAEGHVRVCFSRWESLELERVVGTKRVGRMIKEKGDVFDFV
jgi:U3 small nucleolar RNA-associated protein 25